MREYVVNFLNDFDYPEEAKKELIEAYDALVADEFCKSELDRLVKLYEENINLDYGVIFKSTPEMEKKCGVHHYKSELIVFILYSKHLKKLYNENNIDESIWFNSMLDLKYKLLECKAVKNMWGSFVAWWFPGFFNLTRFALGRLQFETSNYDQEDYTKDGKTVKKGYSAPYRRPTFRRNFTWQGAKRTKSYRRLFWREIHLRQAVKGVNYEIDDGRGVPRQGACCHY